MNIIYTHHNNTLKITLVSAPDENLPEIVSEFVEQMENAEVLQDNLQSLYQDGQDYSFEFRSENLFMQQITAFFLILKRNSENLPIDDITINGETIDNAVSIFFSQYFKRLYGLGLVTSEELNKILGVPQQPDFNITDLLPPEGEQFPDEAKSIHQFIIFLNQISDQKNKNDIPLAWKIEWLFLAYMRCLFHNNNLLEMDESTIIIRLITNSFKCNEYSGASLSKYLSYFNNANCPKVMYEYYSAQATKNLQQFKLNLANKKLLDANQLALTGLYHKGISHVINWIDNEYINLEYKIGDEKYTLLLFAIFLSMPNIAEELIRRGADFFARTASGYSISNLYSVNVVLKQNDKDYLARADQILQLIFNQNYSIQDLIKLYYDKYNKFHLYGDAFTIEGLKAYFFNNENYIAELLKKGADPHLVVAYFSLYHGVNLESARNFLLGLMLDPSSNAITLHEMINIFQYNIFNFEIDSRISTNNDNNNNNTTGGSLNSLDRLILKNPLLATRIFENYRFTKHNKILNSPFRHFLEIKIIDDLQQDAVNRHYAMTYAVVDSSVKGISTFLDLVEFPGMEIRECGSLKVVVARLSLDKFIQSVNMHTSAPVINLSDIKMLATFPVRSPQDYKKAGSLLRKPIMTFIGSLAARKMEKAIDFNSTLKQTSRNNIKRLISKYNLEKSEIHEQIARNFSESMHLLYTASDIDQAFKNILYFFASSDYDLLHATKDFQSVLTSKVIYSHHDLNTLFLSNSGMTSPLDQLYGNNRNVFTVFNTSGKIYPPKLECYYGETVITYSFNELLHLGHQIICTPSDLYYFSLERIKTIFFGATEVVASHHWDSKVANNYKVTKYIVDGQVTHEEKTLMTEQFFLNEDITIGLPMLLINMIRFLDPGTQLQLIHPFIPSYSKYLAFLYPELSGEECQQLILQQQKESAEKMHDFFPACEGAIANRVGLNQAVTNIHYLKQSKKNLASVKHFKKINEIYLAIEQGKPDDEIKNLIVASKNYLNIPHAIYDVTLLVKAMLHGNVNIMQFLISFGADPNQVSRMSNTSSQFTPIMIAIILRDEEAFKILLEKDADVDRVIYLDQEGVASIDQKDEWDQPISAALILALYRPSFNFTEKSTLSLPQKKLLVFLPTATINNMDQVLVCRKGYKKNSDLIAYGNWLLPAVSVFECDRSQFQNNLSYLLDADLDSLKDEDYNLVYNFQVSCMDANYTIYVVRVNLTKEYRDLPTDSGHLALLKWCGRNEIDAGSMDGLPIQHSNLLAIRSLQQFLSKSYAKEFQEELNSPYLLHYAIINNDINRVNELLQSGASANAKISMLHPVTNEWFKGCTPLMTAALYANPRFYTDLVRSLYKAGAKISIQDKKNRLIIDLASPLFIAALQKVIQEFHPDIDQMLGLSVSDKRSEKRLMSDIDVTYESLHVLKISRP